MAEKNGWEETKKDEYFLKGIHLQSEGWFPAEKSEFKKYSYTPDAKVFEKYEIRPLPKAVFRVNSLIHATTPQNAVSILNDRGFKPNKKLLGSFGERNLIWWGISLDEEDVQNYTKDCQAFTDEMLRIEYRTDGQGTDHGNPQEYDLSKKTGELQLETQADKKPQADKDSLYSYFCSSPPFGYGSRYGNIMFKYGISDVLDSYNTQFCVDKKLVYEVMGTFQYKQEVMHAILVRPDSYSRKSSVIFPEKENWKWAPESTGNRPGKEGKNDKWRRWEHVAFAFQIEKDKIFKFDKLVEHMAYCPPADPFRKHIDTPSYNWPFQETIQYLEDQRTSSGAPLVTAEQLLEIISKHLKQIWRQKGRRTIEDKKNYEKNYVAPDYIEHLLIRMEEPERVYQMENNESFCPDKLLEMVDSPPNAERWKGWIRWKKNEN